MQPTPPSRHLIYRAVPGPRVHDGQAGSLVLAHDGLPPEPHDLWTAWSRDPLVWLALAAVGGSYLRGVRALWARAGAGHGLRRWQAMAYAGGIGTLAVALLSPLDALGGALLSAHMAQHLLLIAVAAPLLVLGQPTLALLWAVPEHRRRQLGRWWLQTPAIRSAWAVLTLPLVAWLLHTAALWAWHAPPLYQAALDVPMLHGVEHISFLGTALLFWWTALAPGPVRCPDRRAAPDGVRPRRPRDLRAHAPEWAARGADDVRADALVSGLPGPDGAVGAGAVGRPATGRDPDVGARGDDLRGRRARAAGRLDPPAPRLTSSRVPHRFPAPSHTWPELWSSVGTHSVHIAALARFAA